MNAPGIDWSAEARELKHAIADNAYPAEGGGADIDNHALPLIETTLRDICERYVKALRAAGHSILRDDETHAPTERKFALGDRVTKIKGSSWTGHVVGFYSTELTPVGYAVESENEPGSVQIYPEAAIRALIKKDEE